MVPITSQCIIPIPCWIPVVSIVLYRKMQSFGATCTLKFDPHVVAFSMKKSRACTGMLSYENGALKCSQI